MDIEEFIKTDEEKIEKLLNEHPINIPAQVIADFMGCKVDSVRGAIEKGCFGIHYQNNGLNRGFCIPTGNFVRWYLRIKIL